MVQVNYPPLSRVYDFSKYRILVFENASLQISDCLRILWCGFIAFCESQTRVYDCQARQEPFLKINKCLRFLKPVFSRLRRAQNSQTGVYDFSVKSAQNFRACGGLRIRRHVSTIFVDTIFKPFYNLQTTVYDFFLHRTRSTIFLVSTIFISRISSIYEIVDSCLQFFLSADRHSTNFLKITKK